MSDKKSDDGITIAGVEATSSDAKLDTTHSFTIEWVTPEKRLVGTFACQRLKLGMIGEIAILKARLNGGERLDRETDFLHEMMAFLQVALTDSPNWWVPSDFYDPAILRKVWDYVSKWQATFRGPGVG